MAKYLIEVSHENKKAECARVVEFFLKTGSHFLTQADWGCKDGTHSAWLIVELDTRNEAMLMVPPSFRQEARIVQLNKFTRQEIASLIAELEDGAGGPQEKRP